MDTSGAVYIMDVAIFTESLSRSPAYYAQIFTDYAFEHCSKNSAIMLTNMLMLLILSISANFDFECIIRVYLHLSIHVCIEIFSEALTGLIQDAFKGDCSIRVFLSFSLQHHHDSQPCCSSLPIMLALRLMLLGTY